MNFRTWILLLAVTILSVPAFAQRYFEEREILQDDGGGSYSYDLDNYLDNPCTYYYDQVWVDYNVLLEQAVAESNNRVIFDEMTQMAGGYSATGRTTSDVTYAAPFTLRKYHKVNTGDMFHVVTVIDYYPSTKTSNVYIETACGNGMPDSAQ